MSQGKILSIGSYNVGFTVSTKDMPVWGETIVGKNFFESYGGKGSNQAVTAQKLGGDVTFIGSLGKDTFGKNGLQMLEEMGVNTENVILSNTNTGVGLIILNEENDNAIILDLGANMDLTAQDIERSREVIKQSDTIVFQMEISFEATKRGMEIAKEYGKKVIFNPAPADKKAIELLPLSTVINPNESELLILNGLNPSKNITEEETIELARNLLSKGPDVVIVTRGQKDTVVITQESEEFVKTFSVKEVKDTTGAGDTFTGALAYALTEGKELLEAVKFANLAGAYSVTEEGVIPALPTLSQLEKFGHKNNFLIEA